MNKDVIYIEPEDDITDIILKIENSKEKIVALVPPKKAGVFRSVVNIKLIAKAGVSSDKTVVLVTVDPSILKLAATAKLPVTKDLNSAPSVPTLDDEEDDDDDTSEEELVEEEDGSVEAEDEPEESKSSKSGKKSKEEPEEDDTEDEDEEEEEEEKPAKKPKKNMKLSGNKFLDWIKLHKKLTIFIVIALLGLIGFLIWAFIFAPEVDVAIAIKTDQKNFSENITFTDNLADENAKEGKFYLEQKKVDNVQEVNFDATGQKNRGAKATGSVIVFAYFPMNIRGSVPINAGNTFTVSGLSYAANTTIALSYDGDGKNGCDNKDDPQELVDLGCRVSAKVDVTAVEPGAKYNIAKQTTGWSTNAPVTVYSDDQMAGGTDDIITVVQQADVEKAKNELASTKEEELKNNLYETIDDKYYVIDSTFEIKADSAVATPGVDEEVKEGTKPVLKATTTASVYVIDKVKLEEFIDEKADLKDDQKIYDVRDIYIENISNIKSGATTKLKAQYYLGPKITETEVVDKIKGKGLGDASRTIRDIYGVSDVKIDPSYPWVMSIPGDSNKVHVSFEVKDQDGNEIKEKDENSESDSEKDEKSDDSKKEENKDEKSEKK